MRYLIRLSYRGLPYSGWQIQNNAVSIQGLLQQALSALFRTEIAVTGAGRTDSGVNAVNYIAHFDAEPSPLVESGNICYKLNAILPYEIVVHEVRPTSDEFHSRFDAVYREYKYFLHRKKDPFIASRSYLYTHDLDVDRMNEAALGLIGTKDFSCFEKKGGDNKTSICFVSKAQWQTYEPDHVRIMGYPCERGDYLVFSIGADRFLRNMVRAVVGTLLEVGRGRRATTWLPELISSGVRSDAGQSVPGHALFFTHIDY